MPDQDLLDRIIVRDGWPYIRDIPVMDVLQRLASASEPELIKEYPSLHPGDVQACLLYAARVLSRDTHT
jgi:uncharacterized protein (DUF433 family)